MANLELNVKKLELERIYKEYCKSEIEGNEGEEFMDMLNKFIDFRLWVSGGSESSMGSIGCESVKGFLNEIFLWDNMMCDWGGCYRGEFCWENFDSLEELVNKSNLEENIKIEILEGYRKENGMDEEDEEDEE